MKIVKAVQTFGPLLSSRKLARRGGVALVMMATSSNLVFLGAAAAGGYLVYRAWTKKGVF